MEITMKKLLIAASLVLLAAGCAPYASVTVPAAPSQTAQNQEPIVPQATYVNAQLGYITQYPANWSVSDPAGTGEDISIEPKDAQPIQCAPSAPGVQPTVVTPTYVHIRDEHMTLAQARKLYTSHFSGINYIEGTTDLNGTTAYVYFDTYGSSSFCGESKTADREFRMYVVPYHTSVITITTDQFQNPAVANSIEGFQFAQSTTEMVTGTAYANAQYGFNITLPVNAQGYRVQSFPSVSEKGAVQIEFQTSADNFKNNNYTRFLSLIAYPVKQWHDRQNDQTLAIRYLGQNSKYAFTAMTYLDSSDAELQNASRALQTFKITN